MSKKETIRLNLGHHWPAPGDATIAFEMATKNLFCSYLRDLRLSTKVPCTPGKHLLNFGTLSGATFRFMTAQNMFCPCLMESKMSLVSAVDFKK